ncbi:MAG: methyltransferase domain-containing protein [Candidatus Binatia bacterium]
MSNLQSLQEQGPPQSPSPFLVEHMHRLPPGRVLDVAAGRGRNILYLAEQGFTVHAIDRDPLALQQLCNIARQRQLQHITTEVIDLEARPMGDVALPPQAYDVVLVFFYLFRPLFPALLRTLKPEGILMYETFLVENYLRYQRPRHQGFCLEPGELRTLVSGLHILHYDENPRGHPDRQTKTFTARLLARKDPAV